MKNNAEILERIAEKKQPPIPPFPQGKMAKVPKNDLDESSEGEALIEAVGRAIFIEYKNSAGEISERRISINTVKERSEKSYLYAWCHERKALRSFRLDRIITAIDLGTGEVFETPQSIMHRCLHFIDTPKETTFRALKENRHAINILAFLARCDGQAHPAEKEVINHYILDKCFDIDMDTQTIDRYINGLFPDKHTFFTCIEHIQSEGEMDNLLKYATRLIQADGFIDENETRFILDLKG